jgi:hypothetical protein
MLLSHFKGSWLFKPQKTGYPSRETVSLTHEVILTNCHFYRDFSGVEYKGQLVICGGYGLVSSHKVLPLNSILHILFQHLSQLFMKQIFNCNVYFIIVLKRPKNKKERWGSESVLKNGATSKNCTQKLVEKVLNV